MKKIITEDHDTVRLSSVVEEPFKPIVVKWNGKTIGMIFYDGELYTMVVQEAKGFGNKQFTTLQELMELNNQHEYYI